MTRPLALVDLDDTLFQTARKCPRDVWVDRLSPLAFARDGKPLGLATPRQMRFLRWLAETSVLIPVTARSRDALRRVHIDYRAAICAHGGVILDEKGVVEPRWAKEMATGSRAAAPVLETLLRIVEAQPVAVNARILSETGVPLYLVVKHPDADEQALAIATGGAIDATPADWTIHRNGNNIAFLPPFLGKHHAVAWLLPTLRARHGDTPVIGIGDSITDAPFMALCDYAMTPAGSQLAMAVRDGLR